MKKLIIIGNGFDIAHGIESSYSNYKSWLLKKKDRDSSVFVSMMETFFSIQRDVWGDLETALGEYDENGIIDYCKPDEEIDYDHITRSTAAIEDGPDWLFQPILEDAKENFKEWVDSIDINNVEPSVNFPSNSIYFTFNYTETLEQCYGIPEEKIFHIHGSRLQNDEYIFGHDNYRNPDDAYSDETELLFIQETKSKIIRWMNGFNKNTESIIDVHKDYFEELKNIKIIYVYGHSFSKNDQPYLERIITNTNKDIPWIIYYHSDTDFTNIQNFIKKNGLTNTTLQKW